MSDGVEERLTELEVRVAYQDDLIAKLDAVIRELGDELVAVRHELADLRQRPDLDPQSGGAGVTGGS